MDGCQMPLNHIDGGTMCEVYVDLLLMWTLNFLGIDRIEDDYLFYFTDLLIYPNGNIMVLTVNICPFNVNIIPFIHIAKMYIKCFIKIGHQIVGKKSIIHSYIFHSPPFIHPLLGFSFIPKG
jgi:hypothetical protein